MTGFESSGGKISGFILWGMKYSTLDSLGGYVDFFPVQNKSCSSCTRSTSWEGEGAHHGVEEEERRRGGSATWEEEGGCHGGEEDHVLDLASPAMAPSDLGGVKEELLLPLLRRRWVHDHHDHALCFQKIVRGGHRDKVWR